MEMETRVATVDGTVICIESSSWPSCDNLKLSMETKFFDSIKTELDKTQQSALMTALQIAWEVRYGRNS
jgi:hypothetical protein